MTEVRGEPLRADVARHRDAILQAAVDVLAVHPTASLSEVAARAGLGRATLYRHFPSREALRTAIRDEALARAGSALAEAALDQGPVPDALRRAAGVLVPLGVRFRILLAEGADSDPAFVAARDRVLAPLQSLVERGRDGGDIRPDVDPAWCAGVLTALLMTAVRAVAAGRAGVDQAAAMVAETFLDGLGGRSPR